MMLEVPAHAISALFMGAPWRARPDRHRRRRARMQDCLDRRGAPREVCPNRSRRCRPGCSPGPEARAVFPGPRRARRPAAGCVLAPAGRGWGGVARVRGAGFRRRPTGARRPAPAVLRGAGADRRAHAGDRARPAQLERAGARSADGGRPALRRARRRSAPPGRPVFLEARVRRAPELRAARSTRNGGARPALDAQAWAQARLTRRFALRPSGAARQAVAKATADAEAYIAGDNVWMHHVLAPDGRRLFPKGVRLLTHWNLRDQIKADYAEPDRPLALARQRLVREVMERIVIQAIPQAAAATLEGGDAARARLPLGVLR